ncbi:MAG: hypothetical protein M0Z31_03895 [Clostridia bacterium]|nr:hypothetical protein [Clostridia bacterium]
MIYLLITFMLLLFFYYRFLEQQENQLIESFCNKLGIYCKSVNLSFFLINGKDNLDWGLKLYLYNKGIVISSLFSKSQNILIPFEDMKGLNTNGQLMSFYYHSKGLPTPVKFELSSSPFDENLAAVINQNFLTY